MKTDWHCCDNFGILLLSTHASVLYILQVLYLSNSVFLLYHIKLENVEIANALQLEAARRRAVPIRFNFVALVKFELALPIYCRP